MATRRSTIGKNPLDAIIPRTSPASTPAAADQTRVAADASATAGAPPRRGRAEAAASRAASHHPGEAQATDKITVHLPADLAERAKNAVYWTPGLTLRALATRGIERAVEEAEKAHGGRFQPRQGELTKGRLGG